MSAPLRVGLAGAGWVSGYHLDAYASLREIGVVLAVADPDRNASERRASAYGIPGVFPSLEEMLASVELDAVDIAAPREMHIPACAAAVAAGLPTLCQKPFAPTYDEARDFFNEHRDARIMVHDNWRFRPHYRRIASWIRDGAVGRVRGVECHVKTSGLIEDGDGRYPALVRQPMLAGLKRMLLMEVMIHHVDALRFLLEPLTLTGSVIGKSCDAIAGEDRATLLMKTDSGASVALIGDFMSPLSPPTLSDALTITGESGYITLSGDMLEMRGGETYTGKVDLAADYLASYRNAIAHFLQKTLSGEPYETALADNLDTLRIVEDGYRLAGNPVTSERPPEHLRD